MRGCARNKRRLFLTVSSDGKHLYVASEFSDSVTALAIGSNGNLTQIGDGSGGSGW